MALVCYCTPCYSGTFKSGINIVVRFMVRSVYAVFTVCLQFVVEKVVEEEAVLKKMSLTVNAKQQNRKWNDDYNYHYNYLAQK